LSLECEQVGCGMRHFGRLGDDYRDDLSGEVNAAIAERSNGLAQITAVNHVLAGLDFFPNIAIGQDFECAGDRPGRCFIHGLNPATRDSRRDQPCMSSMRQVVIGAVACFSGDLGEAVDPLLTGSNDVIRLNVPQSSTPQASCGFEVGSRKSHPGCVCAITRSSFDAASRVRRMQPQRMLVPLNRLKEQVTPGQVSALHR
jgi:hypothetical protein